MAGDEIPDILRVPRPLQEKFFHAAEDEADRILKRIGEIDAQVRLIRNEIVRGIRRIVARDGWRDMVIAVVDGSDTPAIDERIGVKYGLYAAAYKLFRGEAPLPDGENYIGDRLNEQIHESRETFLKLLDLVTVYLERTLAKHLLEQKAPHVDMLILDGSFLGYRAGCSTVKDERIEFTEPVTRKHFERVLDLIFEINKLTEAIANSGRAFGIIKRVPTSAIDGYVRYKYGASQGLNLSDRALLSLVMGSGELFSYEDYFEAPLRVEALSWYKTVSKDKKVRGKSPEYILEEAERRVTVQLVADLTDARGRREAMRLSGAAILQLAGSLRRFFIRTRDGIPPICVEVPRSVPEDLLQNFLAYCLETSSPATGLPVSLDLVDDLVSLPRRLGRDFVSEVEARLLTRGVDSSKLLALFSRFNPQKEEF
ncbi:MAG: DNA double-strand break repair nuclease NurA [Nitrososphaerota archaeon]|nr:DNA double-strand break repair nuclease NurA [Candidatus Calditenuaceae archaeon]MDW8072708.1 DNA double-strand break repair nuclease NurA [Nitrososphaerota archaeon]